MAATPNGREAGCSDGCAGVVMRRSCVLPACWIVLGMLATAWVPGWRPGQRVADSGPQSSGSAVAGRHSPDPRGGEGGRARGWEGVGGAGVGTLARGRDGLPHPLPEGAGGPVPASTARVRGCGPGLAAVRDVVLFCRERRPAY